MNDGRGWSGSGAVSVLRVAPAMACFLFAGGCFTSSPFWPEPDDYGNRAPAERLRTVATLNLDERAKPAAADASPSELSTEMPVDPFEGLEKVPVNIEQARLWTLANNLDLQVSLVTPTLERVRLSEEEAKFESTFRTRVRYTSVDQATSSTLSNNQADIFDIVPGVDIPLVTGGTASIELPINSTETNNQFTTLNPAYSSDVAFSISQPLLRGAGREANTYSIRIQALESDIAEARAKLEIIRRLAEVDRAYWRLYAAKRLLVVRQEQFELARTQLQQAERRVRAQVAPEVEIVRAQSGVAERLEAIIRAQNSVRDLQRDLKRIMNVPGLEIGTLKNLETATQPDPVEFELDPEQYAAAAVANRMEMLELELRLAQDFSTIDFQRNQALPLFTLDYRYGINGLGGSLNDSFSDLRTEDFSDWSLGANLSVPLGNEAAEARVHRAILQRLQRLASRDAREQAIRQEVYNAVDNLYASWQRILATRQATILAARTLRAEQNQFEVGARTSTDVLDAATRLADAQSAEIIALTDYEISQVDLAFATGTLMGATKVDWVPRDPRDVKDKSHWIGERRGRVPLGPPNGAFLLEPATPGQPQPEAPLPGTPEPAPSEPAPTVPVGTNPTPGEPAASAPAPTSTPTSTPTSAPTPTP